MRTCVINLARASERLARISAHLASLGITPERVDAVDGSVLTPRDIRAAADRLRFHLLHTRRLQPAELGCALSHRRVYEQLIADGTPRALILEDDAVLHPERLAAAIAGFEEIDPAEPRIHLLAARHRDHIPAEGLHPIRPPAAFATAYLITAAAAARLRAANTPVFTLADDWLTWSQYGINIFWVTPFAATESGAASQIDWKRPARARWRWYRALWHLRRRIGRRVERLLYPRKTRKE